MSGCPDLEPGEPPDGDHLAQLARRFLDQIAYRLLVVADVRLLEQRAFGDELLQLAVNDLGADRLGLGDSLLPEGLRGLVHLAAGLFQGPLAVHHAGAGARPELAYVLRGNRRARHSLQTSLQSG